MTIQEIAHTLLADKKGILAADERNTSMDKKFGPLGIENTEENRRAYREMFFTAPEMEKYVSGVIMYDETLRQSTADGKKFVELLKEKNVMAGIKVDEGTVADGDNGEVITQGLEGLEERLQEYKDLGATFTKWRAVIKIDNGLPTEGNIEKNAELLAKYAKKVQEAGLVPIVEPEVLMDGDHDIDRCYEVTVQVQKKVFEALQKEGVALDGMLLKPNMILPGKDGPHDVHPQQVAEKTVACLKETVPSEVPGIVFLSGGQNEDEAAEHLRLMEAMQADLPWELTFSFGRALQNSALEVWKGRADHVAYAQEVFLQRLQAIEIGAKERRA